MIKRTQGFTVIEIIFIVLVLGIASVLFFIQKNDLAVTARDQQRKTAINAMYYGLEEVFYKANNYYPETISAINLPSVDPALFTDPNGAKIGTAESNYRYTATNCSDNKCQAYTLRTTLEKEADYIKNSRNQ